MSASRLAGISHTSSWSQRLGSCGCSRSNKRTCNIGSPVLTTHGSSHLRRLPVPPFADRDAVAYTPFADGSAYAGQSPSFISRISARRYRFRGRSLGPLVSSSVQSATTLPTFSCWSSVQFRLSTRAKDITIRDKIRPFPGVARRAMTSKPTGE